VPDTSSIGDKSGISMTDEVYCDIEIFNMAPFCHYGSYNIKSRERGDKMADNCILGLITSTKMAMDDGKDLSWQKCVTLRTTALEGA
jgi:hypothetical protein